MLAFWSSLAVVFLAELGDKTQLVALCMATRFKAKVVLAGVLTATLVVHLISIALGGLAGKFLPTNWIGFCAGVAFIIFGMWTLRGDSLDEEECASGKIRSPFWLVTVTFFLAELGDKTMLTTVAMASKFHISQIWYVWIGSSLGMVVSDGLAIWVGQVLGTRLPERAVKIGAACIFFGFGLFNMVTSGRQLPIYAWGVGVAILAALGYLFFRGMSASDKPAAERPAVPEPAELP